jgi:hypothetical protein
MFHNAIQLRKIRQKNFVGGEEGGHQKCSVKAATDKRRTKFFAKEIQLVVRHKAVS